MCLLTFIPPDIQPDCEALAKGARSNSDGHGFAIVIPASGFSRARLLVRKAMKPAGLIKEFAFLRAAHPEGPALFHSRITTDGITDLFNCHPFMVGGDKRTVVAHNGMLPKSVRPAQEDPRSDTRIFAEEVAGDMRLHTMIGRMITEEWIGSFNKLVVLSIDPTFPQHGYILNEEEGEWHKGIWYSNGSYRGYGYRSSNYYGGTASTWTGGGWKEWEYCQAPACDQKYATVGPTTLVCTTCKTCSICMGNPCNCELTHASGKGDAVADGVGGGESAGVTTVIGHIDGDDRADRYRASVEEYRAALEVARRKSDMGDYDVDPDDDPDIRPPALATVLALVDAMNNGAPVEALEGLNIDLDTLLEDLDSPSTELVKYEDPNDDQDYLVHAGTRYDINEV